MLIIRYLNTKEMGEKGSTEGPTCLLAPKVIVCTSLCTVGTRKKLEEKGVGNCEKITNDFCTTELMLAVGGPRQKKKNNF